MVKKRMSTEDILRKVILELVTPDLQKIISKMDSMIATLDSMIAKMDSPERRQSRNVEKVILPTTKVGGL